jgi:hypothetical protein
VTEEKIATTLTANPRGFFEERAEHAERLG